MSNVIHLESPTLAVTLSNRGARLVQLVAKRQNLSLLIDTARVSTELIDQFCIGGTVGPFAGRLRQIDATNGQSALLLHGNEAALHRVDWILEPSRQPNVATYTVRRRHGEGGLPGDRDFSVVYTLLGNGLMIDLTATTTHDTPISLTNHAYFTLGAASVSALSLQINAQSVLLTDAEQCATGGSMPVADTPLDFTRERPLSDALLANPDGLDHSYVLASGGRGALDARSRCFSQQSSQRDTPGYCHDTALSTGLYRITTDGTFASVFCNMPRGTGLPEWPKPCLGAR